MPWDVFVSYASEDQRVARRIAEGLRDAGLEVWFDAFALEAGDSLRRSIDKGLRESRYGVVILSPNFFQKEWPQRELDGLAAREDGKSKVLIPVWYNINVDEVRAFSPSLADKLSVLYGGSLKGVVTKILRAIERDRFAGAKWTPQHLQAPLALTLLPFKPMPSGRVLCVGRYPVTNAEYRQFVNATGHRMPSGERFDGDTWVGPFEPWRSPEFATPDAPVVCVDFWDALEFCEWSSSESLSVFLPSAEIWEVAAGEGRVGVGARQARDRADSRRLCTEAVHPLPVDETGARDNTLGVSDLFGNVWEWCGGNIREQEFEFVGLLGLNRNRPMEAELRGGGFLDDVARIHPALRSGMLEDGLNTRHSDLGFRVAAAAPVTSIRPGIAGILDTLPIVPASLREVAENPRDAYRAYRYSERERRYFEESE